MENLLEKIAIGKGVEPTVVEKLLSIERKLVYKKKRHFRGDFKEIIELALETEVQEQ